MQYKVTTGLSPAVFIGSVQENSKITVLVSNFPIYAILVFVSDVENRVIGVFGILILSLFNNCLNVFIKLFICQKGCFNKNISYIQDTIMTVLYPIKRTVYSFL